MTDIQVIQRVADILNAFTSDEPTVRLASLARQLGGQRSTLHRYLISMANAGLLERTESGEFRPGPGLRRISLIALGAGVDSTSLTRVMTRVSHASRFTVVRSVWSEVAPVVVQRAA